jgi:omega-amidase
LYYNRGSIHIVFGADMNKNLKIHLFQWEVTPGNVEKNIGKIEEMIERTDTEMGDLIILPEMFPSGFFYETLDDISGRSSEILEWMSGKARQYGLGMAGSMARRIRNGICNTMVLVNPGGEILAQYNKIHLFPGTSEDRYFVPGERIVTEFLEDINVGFVLCFDLRFPELSRRLCLDGAVIVLVCAQWPKARIDHFRDLVRVRAMENQMFVAACNSCGQDSSGVSLGGRSMVAGPTGTIAGALGTEEGVLSLSLSLGEVTRVREDFPVLKCRRGDIFGER